MVLTPVGQGPEYDAGHKALDHFEQARDCGHVAHFGLARLGSAQGHLGPIGQRAQDGADGHGNSKVSDLAAGVRALQLDEEERVDYRGCDVPTDRRCKNMSDGVTGASITLTVTFSSLTSIGQRNKEPCLHLLNNSDVLF